MGLCSSDRPGAVAAPQPAPTGAAGAKPGGDPYEVIKIPQLPDLSRAPPELQAFREQCAAGVRQAVAMVTAMEHQLWWERTRRQQAEEDVKVLLAAVDSERDLAGTALHDAQEELEQAREEATGGALVIRATELPGANQAATVIQKNFRGHAARKEFEDHLKSILRGVDPDLDPALLPATAQHHISAVNAAPGTARGGKGVRATLQGMQLSNPALLVPARSSAQQQLRKEVDTIKRRMDGTPDAGQHAADPALDTQLDVKRILQGSLPASSAAVIAALVRRCKELQAALIEACEDLQQSRLAEQGLRAQNMKVVELSQVHVQLEEERASKQALQQVVHKLQHALTSQAAGTKEERAAINPYMAAWYRRQYAPGEFLHFTPSKAPLGQGAHVFAGPEAEVELWDDLRASLPEPVLVPADMAARQYQDLLALHAGMQQGVSRDIPNTLYTSSVPDTSQFKYARDTPIMPVSTPQPLIRETLPSCAYTDIHPQQHLAPTQPTPAAAAAGHALPAGPGAAGQHDTLTVWPSSGRGSPSPVPQGGMPAPYVPVYSTLPLIKEDRHMAGMPDVHPGFRPPFVAAPGQHHSQAAFPQQQQQYAAMAAAPGQHASAPTGQQQPQQHLLGHPHSASCPHCPCCVNLLVAARMVCPCHTLQLQQWGRLACCPP